MLSILLTQKGQFRVLFYYEEFCLSKTLYLRGKAIQLAVLTFKNSPITRLVALKCGSAWEFVISVTPNSVQQTTANVCALQARWAHGSVTKAIGNWGRELIADGQTLAGVNSIEASFRETRSHNFYLFRWLLHSTTYLQGGARGVMVIVVGNGHGDTSSNPGRDWLHFT